MHRKTELLRYYLREVVVMYDDLKGKTALITGAGKRTGMGYALARKMPPVAPNVIIADIGVREGENAVRTALADEMKDICSELYTQISVVKTLSCGC
jgi:NAD(P)-dependent dehydrogenase (short-subunit alcohol dehydrogenase family)